MDDLQQFKQTYITECFELLEEMEERLLNLDEGSADTEELNAIFRCAHSIKGGAGAFGFDTIARFTHILEALLDEMREGKISASREVIDTLLRARDIVIEMVSAANEERDIAADFGSDVVADLESLCAAGVTSKSESTSSPTGETVNSETANNESGDTHCYNIRFVPHSTMMAHGNEPLLLLRELSSLGEITIKTDYSDLPVIDLLDVEVCYIKWQIELKTQQPRARIEEVFEFVDDECDLEIEEAPSAPQAGESTGSDDGSALSPPAAAAAADKKSAKPAPTSIRVDINKVDRLINMVGEVVITQAMLVAQTRDLPPQQFQELQQGINNLSQHTRELQEAVMAVRMQPVKSIFSRMPRLVRDLCGQLDKNIHLTLHGEETEVDKTIIEQLSDPLTHLIRNAADHGIETPETRMANGKPEHGTINLSAEHRGGRIVIEISDDGGGINREKVLTKAREKQLVTDDVSLSDSEIDNMIFAPGFSTADVVSNVSGRGVGMDVVKRNIQNLGGTVSVSSNPGKGSCFTITLPLTLAILDGMIVRVGSEHYIIPIGNIVETLRPQEQDVHSIAGGGSVIAVRGEFVPLLYLYETFSVTGAITDASEALVVLVENGSTHLGVVVDELVGQQQVVIKTLEQNSDPIPGISGATILGDGKVSLILDIGGLQNMADKHEPGNHYRRVA